MRKRAAFGRRRWSAAEDELLIKLYACTRTSELPGRLGRSRMAIKIRAAALHLRKDPDVSMRRRWIRDEDAVIRMLYADTPTDAIAQQLNRSVSSTWQRARKLGLEKDLAYMASEAAGRIQRDDHRGRQHWYPKGHVPANKGLRRPGWGPGRMKETQFRKGMRRGRANSLWRPVGTERISKDGYLERKINEDLPLQKRWRAVHLLVWEAANGPLPRGHAVAFKNGNKSDIRLENLELLTRAQLMKRNTIHNLPQPLRHTVQLLGSLKRKINRRARNEEQDRRSA
jgi:hypothetical protein